MWKSIIYKEWLKTKWFTIGYTVLALLAVGNMFLKVQHDITFYEAGNYWYSILFQGFKYFSYMKFIPIAGAVAIGIAQFFPETVNKRIKLTFHLPIGENKALSIMLLYGTITIALSYFVQVGLFTAFSKLYFPNQIFYAAIVSISPWYLAGFAAYFLIGLIVLEPVWKFRFLYFLIGASYLPIYMESAVIAGYGPLNGKLLILTALISCSLLFSAYRFRKGEM
jgi:hypothetical protein